MHLIGERQKRNLQVLQDIVGSRTTFLLAPEANVGAPLAECGSITIPPAESNSSPDASMLRSDGPISLNVSSSEILPNQFLEEYLQPLLTPAPTWRLNSNQQLRTSLDAPSGKSTQSMNTEKHVYGYNISSARHGVNRVVLSPESLIEDGIKRYGLAPEESDKTLEEELKLRALQKKFSVDEIMKAGLKALSQEISSGMLASDPTAASSEQKQETNDPKLRTDKILLLKNANQERTLDFPDVYKNNIRIKQVLFTAACVTNASILGLGFEASNCDYETSPFFRDSISEEAAKSACQTSFKDLKEHLRPCVAQVMHSHHPYIDVLPFPTFRERVIKLAYADEPMIDEDDLSNDLQNDGLICWGSSLGGGSSATGSGAPWDIRSWEAQPWFLKKWWILIGGAEGEIYKQTQWWCEMRGEKSCYPW